ncbi:MAG TPA: ATP-binding cassette domain-containing protein [Acidimicrobiales bacterium]|nr:ATP-binding cassette domain-containing protein [Acidimicrobiales bacterium]
MGRTGPVVEAEGLHKRYGETAALDGLDLVVHEGSVTALIGPNGAGKTTAVRVLTTLLRPDGGRATVDGFDVVRDGSAVRARIGLVGQSTSVDEVLGGRQNLVMFGRLHHLSRRDARARADELLARFGLAEAGGKAISTYSGGMRRRLDLAASLIRAPRVLFLDEPTTGLDPAGRSEVWGAVRSLVAEGTTVLLTTQYLEEVDQLAHAVHLVDHGRVVAEGSPDDLKSRIGGDRIDVVVEAPDDVPAAAVAVGRATGAEIEVVPDDRRVSAPVTDRMTALAAVVTALRDADVPAEDITVRRPTLDEVFLHLTAHQEVPA